MLIMDRMPGGVSNLDGPDLRVPDHGVPNLDGPELRVPDLGVPNLSAPDLNSTYSSIVEQLI